MRGKNGAPAPAGVSRGVNPALPAAKHGQADQTNPIHSRSAHSISDAPASASHFTFPFGINAARPKLGESQKKGPFNDAPMVLDLSLAQENVLSIRDRINDTVAIGDKLTLLQRSQGFIKMMLKQYQNEKIIKASDDAFVDRLRMTFRQRLGRAHLLHAGHGWPLNPGGNTGWLLFERNTGLQIKNERLILKMLKKDLFRDLTQAAKDGKGAFPELDLMLRVLKSEDSFDLDYQAANQVHAAFGLSRESSKYGRYASDNHFGL